MDLILGKSLIDKLNGNLNINPSHCTIQLIDKNGDVVTPGKEVLKYGDSYLIKIKSDQDYNIYSINVNGVTYYNEYYYTYYPSKTSKDVSITNDFSLESDIQIVITDNEYNGQTYDITSNKYQLIVNSDGSEVYMI